MIKSVKSCFTKTELIIWISSVLFIVAAFLIFDRENFITLLASLIGVTSLIFCAKGNPTGQILMIIFSLIYTYISYTFSYFGEMITYCGMTLPMAVFSLISWLKHPFNGKKSQVKVNKITKKEIVFMIILSLVVTFFFYFILRYFNTENLFISTVSVTTSFLAAYLTLRRSPYFALLYAMNDVVLIILWTYASIQDISYISVLICFIVFFFNDMYGFINWKRMQKSQENI